MTDQEAALALPLLDRPRHMRLQGIGHMIHIDGKELVVQALTDFFQSY